jgi:hypothetical protein
MKSLAQMTRTSELWKKSLAQMTRTLDEINGANDLRDLVDALVHGLELLLLRMQATPGGLESIS